MPPVSSCNCLCPIHWSQVLSREWRCSWSSADRPIKVRLILETWRYFKIVGIQEGRCFSWSIDIIIDNVRTWWRHQMEWFSTLLALCAGNSLVTGEFPSQRPVMQSFDVFFHLCLNKQLSKQSWGWWFEMPSCSLWHHCNEAFCWATLQCHTPTTVSYHDGWRCPGAK